jgi:hypothetical protein
MNERKILSIILALSLLMETSAVLARRPRETVLSERTRIEVAYKVNKHSLTQDYEIIINNKGEVVLYQHNYYDNLDGKSVIKNGKINPDDLRDFKEFIMESNVFGFDNDYVANINAAELGSERIKFTINGEVKEIVMAATTVPARLRAIIDRIEQIKSSIK